MAASSTRAARAAFPSRKKSKNKFKYTCPCGVNVWGKPALKLKCGQCGEGFVCEEDGEDEGESGYP